MTDKQIIIDEVKCPWFNDGSCDLFYSDKEECWYRKCKDTPNCYYRETQTQLKRKEQECKALRDEKAYTDMACEQFEKQVNQLKVENEELKKQACGLRPELKYIIDKTCSKYNINAKYYHEKIVEIINNLDKLKQTLTEIKEIVEQGMKIHDDIIVSKQILQKISEVEDV